MAKLVNIDRYPEDKDNSENDCQGCYDYIGHIIIFLIK